MRENCSSWIYSQVLQIGQQVQLDISIDSIDRTVGLVGYIHRFYRQDSRFSWIYPWILWIGQYVQLDISIDSIDRTVGLVIGYIHRFYRQDSRCSSWIYPQILQIGQQVCWIYPQILQIGQQGQQLDLSIDSIDRTVDIINLSFTLANQ